jgi:hypothetical protein
MNLIHQRDTEATEGNRRGRKLFLFIRSGDTDRMKTFVPSGKEKGAQC